MELVLFIGIQATGKSEYYKQNFYSSHMRINLDMLKTRNRERILINACIEAKQPFVVDNTNPTREDRQKYIMPARENGFSITGYYFSSGIKEALARNQMRTGKACVPRQAILATHKKLELPGMDEGFDTLYYVSIGDNGEFITEEYEEYKDEV